MDEEKKMKKTLKDLTTEEKLRLICGKDCWHTCDFDGKLPFVRVTDASMGVRLGRRKTVRFLPLASNAR